MRGATGLLLALWIAACGAGGGDPEAGSLGDAPDFTLLDQAGDAFESASLRGRPWVANFVFTRCAGVCPMLTARMARLQKTVATEPIGQELRLVSFSIDPDHDRPPVLAEYATRHGADPEHWSFLTGDREEIWDLSTRGFKLAVGENPGDPDEPLFHSGKFVLVDRNGRIRGYYDALESEGFRDLLADLRGLGAGSS